MRDHTCVKCGTVLLGNLHGLGELCPLCVPCFKRAYDAEARRYGFPVGVYPPHILESDVKDAEVQSISTTLEDTAQERVRLIALNKRMAAALEAILRQCQRVRDHTQHVDYALDLIESEAESALEQSVSGDTPNSR